MKVKTFRAAGYTVSDLEGQINSWLSENSSQHLVKTDVSSATVRDEEGDWAVHCFVVIWYEPASPAS